MATLSNSEEAVGKFRQLVSCGEETWKYFGRWKDVSEGGKTYTFTIELIL